jgi:hypothetical protein
MTVHDARERIDTVLQGWEGVMAHPHRFGGTEYRLGKRELGHIHDNALVDIPFPRRVRDEVVAAGEAEPHHLLPDTGWVSVYLREEADLTRAVNLLRRSWKLATRKWVPPSGGTPMEADAAMGDDVASSDGDGQ